MHFMEEHSRKISQTETQLEGIVENEIRQRWFRSAKRFTLDLYRNQTSVRITRESNGIAEGANKCDSIGCGKRVSKGASKGIAKGLGMEVA